MIVTSPSRVCNTPNLKPLLKNMNDFKNKHICTLHLIQIFCSTYRHILGPSPVIILR